MKNEKNFKDFNFKLAAIQVLMYEKEILTPKFDLNEFIEKLTARKIDVEQEGYEIIPEVKEYFEKLEIPENLLREVDVIYQDGGNHIHHQLVPFWDGEDETFNITSTEDISLLPNLKKITLLFDEEQKMVEEFSEKGIEAQYL